MLKFIHAADLHLDSPLSGLERYEGVPADDVRGATRRALENLVRLAVEEEVSFVLIAGDVYDGDWPDYNTGLFFARQMSRLREAGIRVVMVSGNHDAQSRISKTLRLPDNVTVMATEKPQTVVFDDLGVAVHGQGFAKPVVTDDLSKVYPEPRDGFLNIGLLHTSLNGRPGHEPYAPCSVDGLVGKGYDYWALGHVHTREVVSEDPWIVFPGNTQGRHARETGAKGCSVVCFCDRMVREVEHHDLDVLRWQVLDVDVAGSGDSFEVVERVAAAVETEVLELGDKLLALRLRLVGECPAHRELVAMREDWIHQVRSRVTDLSFERVWVEKILVRTRPVTDLGAVVAQEGAMGDLLRGILEIHDVGNLSPEVAGLFDDLRASLSRGLKNHAPSIAVDDPESLRAVLGEVKELLVARLLAEGAAE